MHRHRISPPAGGLGKSRHGSARPGTSTPLDAPDQAEAFDFDRPLTVAVDTEFHGVHTLTIQAATRLDRGTLAVQLYRSSPGVPAPPDGFSPEPYLDAEGYARHFDRVVFRPVKKIRPAHSPAALVRDLFGVTALEPVPLAEGLDLVRGFDGRGPGIPKNVTRDPRTGRWRVPAIGLTVVGHFLAADLYRMFGREYLEAYLASLGDSARGVGNGDGKLLTFDGTAAGMRFGRTGPVMEYARKGDGRHFEVRVATRDTALAFGEGSLDDHSRTFAGVRKGDALSRDEKAELRTGRILRAPATPTRDTRG